MEANVDTAGIARHLPKPLSELPPASAPLLIEDGRNKRLVIYLGAGVSIPMPADGPRGNDVADRLRPLVAKMLGVEVDDLADLSLEALSERVGDDDANRLDELKQRAADAANFRNMEPNYGHEVLALLMREGIIQVVSANWDCAVEVAGGKAGIPIEGVSRGADLDPPPVETLLLFKVHGCARRPETLVLTRAEVDEPELWARSRVQQALTGGTVVFLGLGTLGAYVSEPISEMVPRWIEGAASVHVVDPFGLSEQWEDALGDHDEDVGIVVGSDEFLDDLIRAAVNHALSDVDRTAQELNDTEQKAWSQQIIDGYEMLARGFLDCHGDAILRWWRDGVSASEHGSPFIFTPAGQRALICVSLLLAHDGGNPQTVGEDGDLTVRSPQRYFEIACQPGKHWHEARRGARARVERRRRGGRYATGTPITVVIPDATGEFPSVAAPVDIAANNQSESDIAAENGEGIIYVSAEDAVQGRIAA
ncbi:MAG TPA: SIR2 family protein [Solirubrobacterales bacterium]|nr:SIR2 family protein [Solirubrobacterales bacterium]